ncbi:MAG: hypothetical protein KY475_17885 [Planctomycetes bacterium]|nr:hypothetical protein [Planctomycetota bacterium]
MTRQSNMAWEAAIDAEAVLGGCYFRHVPVPLQYGDDSIVQIRRSLEGSYAVTCEVYDQEVRVASVSEDAIDLVADREQYGVSTAEGRRRVYARRTGRMLFDEATRTVGVRRVLFASLLTRLPNGCVAYFHPDRIRIGTERIVKPHLSSMLLKTNEGAPGPAVRISEVRPKPDREDIAYAPGAPMVGGGGVVQRMLALPGEERLGGDSVLFMYDRDAAVATSLNMSGPCYFLDVGWESFQVGISVDADE